MQLVVVGPFGVGKSSAVDVCQWQLCASKESSKIDPGLLLIKPFLPLNYILSNQGLYFEESVFKKDF